MTCLTLEKIRSFVSNFGKKSIYLYKTQVHPPLREVVVSMIGDISYQFLAN